ncbi:TPM domain-containing protein [Aquimarina agarivorans]|uniref:TPM domain-containing protein n=1 Tax=Aquimarina agarivorans TaxID=980584 RepID=UPI000248E705|nr:TPM domain-containing protein [Aquimarina agarivorans]
MGKLKIVLALLFVFVIKINTIHAQFDIPPKPAKATEQVAVYDYANILSPAERRALEIKLIKYSDTTSTQIVIATINSLKGEAIGILTPKWAHKWGIGQADKDNGVFILLSKNDRKIHISPGYGVEQYLTAGQVGTLTREIILPEFRAGSYYQGLDKGTSAIIQMLNGTYKGTRIRNRIKGEGEGIPFMFIVFFLIFLLIIWSSKKNKGGDDDDRNSGNSRKARSLLDVIILSNMGRGGYSGGSFGRSSGGGGFGGGFGGGGFSGGGAGGSW